MNEENKLLTLEEQQRVVASWVSHQIRLSSFLRKAEILVSTVRPASKTSKQSMVLTLAIKELLAEMDEAAKLLNTKI